MSYAYRDFIPAGYSNHSTHNEAGSFMRFSPQQKVLCEQALAMWSDVARITFTPVDPAGYSNNATILFANYTSSSDGSDGFTLLPGGRFNPGQDFDEDNGDVWINIYDSINNDDPNLNPVPAD